ncbi:hypothetical protein [Mucilaginibacter lacusdianchii]|uniref:hypothetical protein n=1 Tax=Mucilaginibacter lacusdianchii TaxID=2684211 RepID=UPI0018EF31BC|nr:hypothetical protein [Mucilaginibacter sp. JXJ CY 39]
MKKAFYKGRFIFIPLIAAAVLAIASLIVMQLWNNILPDVLHVSSITFWQAMGIFVLCKVLFGFGRGGRFGGGAPWGRGRMAEKFKNMSPEERAKFKEQFADRMCHGRGSRWRREWDEDVKKPADETAD